MRLVIDYGGVRRDIDGEFLICADRGTFKRIKRAIDSFLDGEAEHGWVEIRAPLNLAPDLKPRPWARD